MTTAQLDSIFRPGSIALIGASDDPGTVGEALINNLIDGGYKGRFYPVNVRRDTIHGLKAYKTVTEIQDSIDLAVIATPAHTIPAIVEECGRCGVGGLVIISSGFQEAGEEGSAMLKQVLATARHYNMRILGPNCMGFLNPRLKLNMSFSEVHAAPGRVAFISQSGALCTAILDWAAEQSIGFSYFVSLGSMKDIGFDDLIDYFGNDPNTSSILIYMESLTHARKFISAARAFTRNKPIIILKAGKSSEGAKAAQSHTGAMAGNDFVFDAAFRRAGIIRVNTINELFNLARVLSLQYPPKGNRLAIVSNAGGPAVLGTDHLIQRGGKLARLSDETISELNTFLPRIWSGANPIDMIGTAGSEEYAKAAKLCLKDPNVDGVLVIMAPVSMVSEDDVAKAMIPIAKGSKKTFLTCFMGEKVVDKAREILEEGKVPVYNTPEDAVTCFVDMYDYTRNLKSLYEVPTASPVEFQADIDACRAILKTAYNEGRSTLTEQEARLLLQHYEIPVVRGDLAKTSDDAVRIASDIGFPVAMKIVSPDILHKTDVGGVKLNLRSENELIKAFHQMMESVSRSWPEARIDGILVSQMQKKRYELLIGANKDPIFGPVIVFGMGGVTVELFRDLHIALPPLNMALAGHLMEGTKVARLLEGYRGMPAADIEYVKQLLCRFASLVIDLPEIKEIDINPFAIDETGAFVLDAKVVIDMKVIEQPQLPHEHLVIATYPKEYITEWRMDDGQPVLLRPIRPEDEPLEAEMFRQLSDPTEYFRFFRVIKEITHEELVRFTHTDYDRELAIIAEVEEGGEKKMAGVARLIADAYNENAEFAIIVADPWQRKGLGTRMIEYSLQIAASRGIPSVYATILKENLGIIRIFKRMGFDIREEVDNGTYTAFIDLTDPEVKKRYLIEQIGELLQA